MDSFLPKEFQPGRARGAVRRTGVNRNRQLHVEVGSIKFPVLRTWSTGFVAEEGRVPMLSGVVDVFDGAEHLYRGLIVASELRDGERVFEVKRANSSRFAGMLEMGDMPVARSSWDGAAR